jgi:hypothetical protein
MFPKFSLKKNFRPHPFEEFYEIHFQFYIVSILLGKGCDHK